MTYQVPGKVPAARMRRIGTLVDLVASMPKSDPRYALLLGAGASVSSGIPHAGKLISLWQRRVFLDKTDRNAWRPHYDDEFREWRKDKYRAWKEDWEIAFGRHPSDYSILFSYICPDADARQGFIERLMSASEPGPGYIYLAALTLAKYFHTFLTTNFDDLIHDALFRYAGLKPMVCAFDSQVSSVRLQTPRPKVIKLHGDFLYNNIRNVGPEVAKLDVNMEEKFERTCENYGLIVIGFAGQDQSVMAPLRSMLHRRERLTHGLHWCVYRAGASADDEFRSVPEELYRMWEAYPDKVHLYDVGTFDEVMEAFYLGCRCPPPPELAHPEEKALYAKLRDGLENADQTWQLSAEFSALLQQFREAATRAPPPTATLLDKADQYHRNATKLKALDLDKAEQAFAKAVEKATQALAGATLPQQVHAYRRLGGSRSNIGEVIVKRAGLKNTVALSDVDKERLRDLQLKSLEDVRKGLAIDNDLRTPPELRGHRINLWFNGLICYAYLLELDSALTQEDVAEGVTWLQSMAADELLGDDYVTMLADEIGGPELLKHLCRAAEKMSNSVGAGPISEPSAQRAG